jgi:hypothetical protein
MLMVFYNLMMKKMQWSLRMKNFQKMKMNWLTNSKICLEKRRRDMSKKR